MKNRIAPEHHTTRGIVAIACTTALAAAFTASLTLSAHAAQIILPDNLPPSLVVDPEKNHPFLLGKAEGTQNYVCLPDGVDAAGNPKFAWKLFTPEATLFGDDPGDPKQLITHFFSPNLAPTHLRPAPTHRLRTARFARRGSTRGIRAPSGPGHLLQVMPLSSSRMPFPGSSLPWSEPRTGLRVGTCCRSLPSSSV